MMIVVICEKYHWDYYQYLNQPAWFLELVQIKMRLDNERVIRESNKTGRR